MEINYLSDLDKSTHIISTSIWMLSVIGILFVSMVVALIFRHKERGNCNQTILHQWGLYLIHVAKKPFITLFSFYIIYEILMLSIVTFPSFFNPNGEAIIYTCTYFLRITEFIAFFWFVLNALNQGQESLYKWALRNNRPNFSILLPMVGTSLKAAVLLIMINMLIPELGITGFTIKILEKVARVSLVVILSFLCVQLVNGFEKLILIKYNTTLFPDAETRKINTQVRILKKVFLSLVFIVTIAAALMVFDSVKHLGAGLLTTAGIISALGAFASQQSLSRIFSGLQIAFTQPISIGDTVIIEKESGQIEEITLSHIVVKMWDLRRLILPTDYFSNKGLQSLSRYTPELIGTIYFYTDFTMPVPVLRNKFQALLSMSKYWNQQTGSFEVTALKETSMEIRALVSAENPAALGNLSCEIREKLMKFIVQNYPECLPKTRTLITQVIERERVLPNMIAS